MILLSGAFLGFCDRLFLAYHSIEALEACTSTLSLCSLFQIPGIRMVMIIQSFIGKYKGEGNLEKIGQCVWQMIWFSLLFLLLTLLLSLSLEHLFFRDTSVAYLGIPYFRILIVLNLLLPLGAALSSFYLGQGKSKTVVYATLLAQATNLALDPLLIFGIKGFCPSYGIQGAAVATVISQCLFCAFLFWDFLKIGNRITFATSHWGFKKELFLEYLKIGVPRSISRGITLLTWTTIVYFLTRKGELYLLVLSFGASLHLIFTFIIEGMGQAIVIIGSYLVGIKEIRLVRQLVNSAGLFLLLIMTLLAIPLVLYSDLMIAFLIPSQLDTETQNVLRYTCYWSCLLFMAQGLNSIGHNLLTAFHDTLFQMIFNAIMSWFWVYVTIFLVLGTAGGSPDKVWVVMTIAALTSTVVYFLRAYKIATTLAKLPNN